MEGAFKDDAGRKGTAAEQCALQNYLEPGQTDGDEEEGNQINIRYRPTASQQDPGN